MHHRFNGQDDDNDLSMMIQRTAAAALLLLLGSFATATDPPRYALLLCGAVSRIYHHGSSLTPQSHHIYMGKQYPFTPVEVTGSSILKHIIAANGGPSSVDTYIHCWNREVETRLRTIYNASLITAQFDDNRRVQREEMGRAGRAGAGHKAPGRLAFQRSDWRQVSWAISMSRAIALMVDHCEDEHKNKDNSTGSRRGSSPCYDGVIIYRPDVLLLRDLRVSELGGATTTTTTTTAGAAAAAATAFVGHWMNGHGDMHLVMPFAAAVRFGKTVLPYLRQRDNAKAHAWLPGFLKKHLGLVVEMDHLRPGWDEEVYRKIPWAEDMSCHGWEPYQPYGMTLELWNQLGRMEYRNCERAAAAGESPRRRKRRK